MQGWVDYATWLAEDLLLVVGWFPAADIASTRIDVVAGGRILPSRTECLPFRRLDIPGPDFSSGKFLAIRFLTEEPIEESAALSLVVRTRDNAFTLQPGDLSPTICAVHLFVARSMVNQLTATRTDLVGMLAHALTTAGTNRSPRYRGAVATMRTLLGDALEPSVIRQGAPRGIVVDAVFALDDRTFCAVGWCYDRAAPLAHLVAISPEGQHVALHERLFRYWRADVAALYASPFGAQAERDGFVSLFRLPEASARIEGWRVQMRNAHGTTAEAAAPPAVRDPLTARNALLGMLSLNLFHHADLMHAHLFPAISHLQERIRATLAIECVTQYGLAPDAPTVSVVVPLYRRVDLMEQQLAHFADDAELRAADLIYVLDSPEQADALREGAEALARLYGVPFRLVVLTGNAGFSVATNLGASLARGRVLLLLNSDVFPRAPGWLGRMVAHYDATGGIGALGVKLLYPDDALQHAGMYFAPTPDGLWKNMHYFKGLHRTLPAANIARIVPAVTGACLMLDRALFDRVGGLRNLFVQGDFEDSDLCMRLAEEGYCHWYLPSAELYHLEGQSYDRPLRQRMWHYNQWANSHLWGERMATIMRDAPAPYETPRSDAIATR